MASRWALLRLEVLARLLLFRPDMNKKTIVRSLDYEKSGCVLN